VYKKLFSSQNELNDNYALPSPKIRAIMLKGTKKGTELDRRDELHQIIHEFPKIDKQKILKQMGSSRQDFNQTFDTSNFMRTARQSPFQATTQSSYGQSNFIPALSI
jgi:hypothetical protein